MSRAIHILWAGRHKRAAWEALYEDYRSRITRNVKVLDRPIKAKTGSDDPARLRAEGKALLAALPQPCWTVALDERGKHMSSPELARWLRELWRQWPHPVAFVIGSDLGLDPSVTRAARLRLSLGPMTFGHELARLVLYEQLYRASAIERGINYHR